jgi:hypothetical protein
MTIPTFTAEASLGREPNTALANRAMLIDRGNALAESHDTVVPQYSCGFASCSCVGYEDCYQMTRSGRCWRGQYSCQYAPAPYYITCWCPWATT